MQFFYIDYMNGDRKERNIGFLRVEGDGISVGLRGVPVQCGSSCRVYALNCLGKRCLLGEVKIKNGYGMEKLSWTSEVSFMDCLGIEIPLYGSRIGKCVLREQSDIVAARINAGQAADKIKNPKEQTENTLVLKAGAAENAQKDMPAKKADAKDEIGSIDEDKWAQLLETYPRVHIFPEAQSILIKPKDLIVLTEKYHNLASNSFVLHSYYNYRQLLLFCYPLGTEHESSAEQNIRVAERRAEENCIEYYLGVPGTYYERERRIAEMFGFEGFENAEARMHDEIRRGVYSGCFGYYMKRVEI